MRLILSPPFLEQERPLFLSSRTRETEWPRNNQKFPRTTFPRKVRFPERWHTAIVPPVGFAPVDHTPLFKDQAVKKTIAALALAVLLLPAHARADMIHDLSVGGTGSVTYAGGNAALVGNNLTVTSVDGATVNDTLSFMTGGFVSSTASSYDFAKGGSITITQGGNSLLTGSFTSDTIVTDVGSGNFKVVAAGFSGTLSPAFEKTLGTTDPNYTGGLSLLFNASGVNGAAFTNSTVQSGNMGISTVPEPSTMVMAGTAGAFALGYGLRRRRRASV